MVFNFKLQEISLLLGSNFFWNRIPDPLCIVYIFYQLETHQLFLYSIFIWWSLESLDLPSSWFNFVRHFGFISYLPPLYDFSLSFLYFKKIHSVLFFQFHQCSPQLYSLLKVFIDVLLYFFHILIILRSVTITMTYLWFTLTNIIVD